jgi:hypothetical protein
MKAADDRLRNLRTLRLAKSTIYDLAEDLDTEEEAKLPAIIDALAEVATKKQISRDDAYLIIWRTKARRTWGDLPDPTLEALEKLDEQESWAVEAIKALKEKKPQTEEAAADIVKAFQPPEPEPPIEDDEPVANVIPDPVLKRLHRRADELAREATRTASAMAAAVPGDIGPVLVEPMTVEMRMQRVLNEIGDLLTLAEAGRMNEPEAFGVALMTRGSCFSGLAQRRGVA